VVTKAGEDGRGVMLRQDGLSSLALEQAVEGGDGERRRMIGNGLEKLNGEVEVSGVGEVAQAAHDFGDEGG
jgi:hypothetical protein